MDPVPSCRVTVVIDQHWVAHFRDKKINLCSAFGVQTNYSKSVFNIIASSEDPTPLNTISWTDVYSIAACKRENPLGSYVFPNTAPQSIKPGSSATLLASWTMQKTNISSLAPEAGFLFINQPSASAILFKYVRNILRPIYVTSVGHDGTPPPGRHELVPTRTILLFFAATEAQTSFDVAGINTEAYELDYAMTPRATIKFTREGSWLFVDEGKDEYMHQGQIREMVNGIDEGGNTTLNNESSEIPNRTGEESNHITENESGANKEMHSPPTDGKEVGIK